jgi:hypothetical protein
VTVEAQDPGQGVLRTHLLGAPRRGLDALSERMNRDKTPPSAAAKVLAHRSFRNPCTIMESANLAAGSLTRDAGKGALPQWPYVPPLEGQPAARVSAG